MGVIQDIRDGSIETSEVTYAIQDVQKKLRTFLVNSEQLDFDSAFKYIMPLARVLSQDLLQQYSQAVEHDDFKAAGIKPEQLAEELKKLIGERPKLFEKHEESGSKGAGHDILRFFEQYNAGSGYAEEFENKLVEFTPKSDGLKEALAFGIAKHFLSTAFYRNTTCTAAQFLGQAVMLAKAQIDAEKNLELLEKPLGKALN